MIKVNFQILMQCFVICAWGELKNDLLHDTDTDINMVDKLHPRTNRGHGLEQRGLGLGLGSQVLGLGIGNQVLGFGLDNQVLDNNTADCI